MKRDADIVRKIAIATENLAPGEQLTGLSDVDHPTFVSHVQWMKDAGLVEAAVRKTYNPMEGGAVVLRLTWDGCDFLDAAREQVLWEKAKTSVIKPGASWTFDILKDWLKAEIREGFPTLRSLS